MTRNIGELVQLMKGRDPQQFVLSMLQNKQITDPRIKQMIQFAQGGNIDDLVNLASSMMAQKGLNLNNEFSSFMSMMK